MKLNPSLPSLPSLSSLPSLFFKTRSRAGGGVPLALGLSLLGAPLAGASVLTFTVDQPISSDSSPVSVQITLDDAVTPGSVRVTASVQVAATGHTADIRGVFFHVADESLLPGLSATGSDVTGQLYGANAVLNLGGGVNLNPASGFDGGVEIGTPGIGGDDIQSTVFTLSHPAVALTNTSLSSAAGGFGVRLTSVGAPGDARDGSSKVSGEVPEPATAALMAAGAGLLARRRRPPAGRDLR